MGIKVITKNKRASFDYALADRYEAGLQLVGTEVKSIRASKVKIAESFIKIDNNMEAWIYNMHIAHYEQGNIFNHEESRKRKLLLNRKEIEKIHHLVKSQQLTIVPTILYFKRARVKIEIALARGKKLYDKRHDQKEKDIQRKLQRGDFS